MEKDHLEIILESMEKQFQIVLEGHSSLANQIAMVDRRVTELSDFTEFKFQALSDRIDAVDEKLTKRIDAVAADMKATDEKLTNKIDAVADDLKAHRVDTETHGNAGLYGAEWVRIINLMPISAFRKN